MPAENVLEVHHLSKHVGQGEHQLTILTGVELLVKPAQTIALIGESGSGKSTLLGILAGLDDGSEGEVRLLGESLTALDEEAAPLRARNVGFVFQSFMLVPTLNALENVQLPALLRGESDRAASRRCSCWNSWDWANGSITCRRSCPAASSSGAGARLQRPAAGAVRR